MKIIFFGTADFGIPALTAIQEAGHELLLVVTNPPKPAGRGQKLTPSPVAAFCESQDIGPVQCQEDLRDEAFLATLKSLQADLYVVVAFSILPKELFTIPPLGTYNIHAALLPLFRGPAPIHRAIETGATESGVTVFRIDVGVDTGNVVLQKRIPIRSEETTPQLYTRLSELGAIAITDAITYISDDSMHLTEQDHSQATKAPLLKKSEALIDWTLSAVAISRKVRAFKPFPGTYTFFNQKRLGIEEVFVSESVESLAPPGTVLATTEQGVQVACGKGIITLVTVKPEGKRAMSVHDYIHGIPLPERSTLG